jgi:flagellar hook-associated protein 3 FlgL
MFNNQSRDSLSRLQMELADLSRQVASGKKENDLRGYGASAATILSARGMIAQTDAYAASASALEGRFQTIDLALGRAADAGESLRMSLLNAIGSGDGRYIADALQRAFDSSRAAMNEDYQGEALFAGERIGADPVNVSTLAQLAAAPSVASIFNEASRPKTVDLGEGSFAISERASDVATPLFDAMRDLRLLLDANGGSLPYPLTSTEVASLQTIITDLTGARDTLVTAQGRNGEVQKRVESDAIRLSDRSDALAKTVSDVADADLAEVAMRISAVEVQYQAVAQTFSQLSGLTLLNFLDYG